MLIDLIYRTDLPDHFDPHEEYIINALLDAINSQRRDPQQYRKLKNEDTRRNINIYRRLDNDQKNKWPQYIRCMDLLRCVIKMAWDDAMAWSGSQATREARAWWLTPDNSARKWMLDALGIADQEQKLRRMVRNHINRTLSK